MNFNEFDNVYVTVFIVSSLLKLGGGGEGEGGFLFFKFEKEGGHEKIAQKKRG